MAETFNSINLPKLVLIPNLEVGCSIAEGYAINKFEDYNFQLLQYKIVSHPAIAEKSIIPTNKMLEVN